MPESDRLGDKAENSRKVINYRSPSSIVGETASRHVRALRPKLAIVSLRRFLDTGHRMGLVFPRLRATTTATRSGSADLRLWARPRDGACAQSAQSPAL